MSLQFHPQIGTVLICDFSSGFKAPEMVKKRPVVVIAPRHRHRSNLCTVVPLSTTKPQPIQPYHHKLNSESLPGKFAERETWAKCDMIVTVSFTRLDRVKIGINQQGKRLYACHSVIAHDLIAIQRAVLYALGLGRLTPLFS